MSPKITFFYSGYLFGQAIAYLATGLFLLTYSKTTFAMLFLGHIFIAITIFFSIAPFNSSWMKKALSIDALLVSGVTNIAIVIYVTDLLGKAQEKNLVNSIIVGLLILYFWVLMFGVYVFTIFIKRLKIRGSNKPYPRSKTVRNRIELGEFTGDMSLIGALAGGVSIFTKLSNPFYFVTISLVLLLIMLVINPKFLHVKSPPI